MRRKKAFLPRCRRTDWHSKNNAESCVKLDQLEVSIDTLDREKFKQRRGIDGLPTILSALDYIADNKLKHNLVQINAAVDETNLEDLPALAEFCTERGFLLHTEAVHNVVRTTFETENVEIEDKGLDKIAAYVLDLKKKYKCVRFYTDYYKFYRDGGFTKKFPCRSASHLINMRPDGAIQFPCAFVSKHKGAPEMSLKDIYASPEVREIIKQSPDMWDFCKGCKIGCPYEVSAYRNNPWTAVWSAMEFFAARLKRKNLPTKDTKGTKKRKKKKFCFNFRLFRVFRGQKKIMNGSSENNLAVRVAKLFKSYRNGTEATRGIDFTVRCGEAVSILGPNGAGKTTFLRQLTTELKTDFGRNRDFRS